MLDVLKIKDLIAKNQSQELANYIKQYDLVIKDGKITATLDQVSPAIEYYDIKQVVKKLGLNSTYGALLNAGCRFFDQRIGQSTTLSGRCIAKHMDSYINECLTGDYNHTGDSIIYGDSVVGSTQILTNSGYVSIQELFDSCRNNITSGEKEYGYDCVHKVSGYDAEKQISVFAIPEYIMRHKTKKKLYQVILDNDKSITVTQDHSLIVEQLSELEEVTPIDILPSDIFICINDKQEISRTKCKTVICLGEVDDYVYDISIADQDPFFFGNDILVHNTDSGIFSAWPMVKDSVESGELSWTTETALELYDSITKQVNDSFPAFMEQAFHCTRENGSLIRGGRELLGTSGLFISKKRYAILMCEYEGTRFDLVDDATAKKKGAIFGIGKVKAMGLDLKRADTPQIVQKFLSEILLDVLTNKDRLSVIEKIREFKKVFGALQPWEKGTPKRVNKLTSYTAKLESGKKGMIPGHVTGAINWNKLRMLNNDHHSPKILDGMKTLACKIKKNPSGMTTVGYPIDIAHLPTWFTELPFDVDAMEKAVVDKKISNLLSVMNWDIEAATEFKSSFNAMFSFA